MVTRREFLQKSVLVTGGLAAGKVLSPDPDGRRCAGRDSSPGPCGPPAGSSPPCPSRPRPPRGAGRRHRGALRPAAQRRDRGQERVDHRLVARLGLAARLDALDAGLERVGPAAESSSSLPAVAPPICRNSVPYSGPAAPPTLETSAMPTAFRSGADVGALQRRRASRPPCACRGPCSCRGRRRRSPCRARQLRAVLGDHRGEAADPGADVGGGRAHVSPTAAPACRPGASQSRVSSSSSFSSVIEQPAISSEVM